MSQGYYGNNYDRQVERKETSTLHKMKETFWTTKQAVIQKLGKKEDEHVVASDSELDSKLEVFRAIQKSSMELLRVIEKYQDRLCALSQDENSAGRFLKSQSNIDKTRAGKMMAAVGKSQSFAAQQRLALRVPLVRLYQEVETFRYRAISDTLMTINRMEGARTEYRGALLWMKAVSEELDPDTFKQLEKFRKVQAQVRKTKARFDKLKLDVMQKVDLLAASRCNMFSHVLANYQSTLLHFWEKTSRTMSAVAESFKGYQHYEFSIIKELAEPSKALSEGNKSRTEPAERDTDDDFDPSNSESGSTRSDKDSCQDCKETAIQDQNNLVKEEKLISISDSDSIEAGEGDRLISLDEESNDDEEERKQKETGSLQNLYESESEKEEKTKDITASHQNKDATDLFIEFEEDESQKSDDFDFSGKILQTSIPKAKLSKGKQDLLSDDIQLEADDSEKDDMTILNEILNAPSTGGDDFTREWQAVFGNVPLSAGTTYTPVESDQSTGPAEFMPSSLLDMTKQMASMNIQSGIPQEAGMVPGARPAIPKSQSVPLANSHQDSQQSKPKSKKGDKKDMSAWFSLFADLDPLSNPDAIGKTNEDMTDA